MDPSKKRRIEDNGVSVLPELSDPLPSLTPEEGRKMIDNLSKEQLLDILQSAVMRHPDVLAAVRAVADADTAQRKLFIRGLGWETTTEGLRSLFSAYGEIEEAVVIIDKGTGKSKGYGFVTFKHVDGAILALREPSKKIDGRVTVTQLAAAGNSASHANAADVANRKIYVANVPADMPSDKLLSHFSLYGEIEEGPLGFDKLTGKSRGFALFVYKTAEGAQAALVDPVKMIDGKQLSCKMAIDGKKKSGGNAPGGPTGGSVDGHSDGMAGPNSMPGSMGQYGPGGMGPYSGFPGGLHGQPPLGHMNSSSLGGPGLGGQPPSSLGGGGYGPYSGYGPGSTGYGNLGGGGLGGSGGMGGVGGGGGGSMYRPSGGYPEGGHYNLPSSGGYPGQHHQPTGTSPAPRGMYPNVPPYY
ncbi:UBP1-associated protein 2C [Punica granatum]|uniref:RRM domain-containing protein n=2 Tax=Punica granatum TaxID=22663 RepID=A0A218XVS4_PUNGR|nr:UBP1-associated protein 2C [Punica granatum]OWM88611.1 hypothetical protein CDL15_Pgr002378 [Punica granatum]PKI37694.1 hypothetical protein CRG98_041987 [Punica granatum]